MTEGQVVESIPQSAAPAVAASDQAPVAPTGAPEGQNGQAIHQDKSAPVEENFSSIDPNTLPPELQGIYKNLQRDYTKKLQATRDELKKFSPDVLEKAQRFEQISKDERFAAYWNGLNKQQQAAYTEQKAQAEKTLGELIPDDVFQKAWESKDGVLGLIKQIVQAETQGQTKKIQELEQKNQLNESATIVESFATELGEDGKPVRPDFYDLNTDEFPLISGFLEVNPPKQGETPQQSLDRAYKWAKNLTQQWYEKGKSEGLAVVQKKAAMSTQMPTHSAKNNYAGIDPKKIDVAEAVALARKGIRIPQD